MNLRTWLDNVWNRFVIISNGTVDPNDKTDWYGTNYDSDYCAVLEEMYNKGCTPDAAAEALGYIEF